MVRIFKKIALITSPSIIFIFLIAINAEARNPVGSPPVRLLTSSSYNIFLPLISSPFKMASDSSHPTFGV